LAYLQSRDVIFHTLDSKIIEFLELSVFPQFNSQGLEFALKREPPHLMNGWVMHSKDVVLTVFKACDSSILSVELFMAVGETTVNI